MPRSLSPSSFRLSLLALCGAVAAGASTQIQAQIPGGLTSALPDVASTGAGNAAGVLSYCMKQKLVDSVEGNSVYGLLAKKPEVAEQSDAFKTGSTGTLLSSGSAPFSLDKAPKSVRKTVCNMVLKQSRSLL
ncbi:MAG: DUF2501 domain-containing protein [Novosphingobium pentaromativorans]|uniref:DUF2501 domain-containing protein n=1 Tax=Novosphingobium pentaromativorans TaxID=205844 RepID=A0A2W5NXQ8_9SPHN|nr:MAG: DUF2501 domain-containing protein [Novosphingobium pentaromativorans]